MKFIYCVDYAQYIIGAHVKYASVTHGRADNGTGAHRIGKKEPGERLRKGAGTLRGAYLLIKAICRNTLFSAGPGNVFFTASASLNPKSVIPRVRRADLARATIMPKSNN